MEKFPAIGALLVATVLTGCANRGLHALWLGCECSRVLRQRVSVNDQVQVGSEAIATLQLANILGSGQTVFRHTGIFTDRAASANDGGFWQICYADQLCGPYFRAWLLGNGEGGITRGLLVQPRVVPAC